MDRVMQTIHVLRSTFIAALFLCASVIAHANIAGQVIMVKGSATAISADGKERVLQRRSEINASDTIVTGSDSRVQIRFLDNALLALQEKSRLNIHEYRLANNNGESEKVLMELVEGGFRTLTGTIGKGNREAYAVNTPVASIGVRGTLYSVHLNGGQLSAGVWQGGIVITTPNGREVNLGRDSSFSFGVFRNNNFRGLRTPPADLDAGDNNDVGGENNSNNNDNDLNNGDDTNADNNDDSHNAFNSSAPEPILATPNTFEQMDSSSTNKYVEDAGAAVGITDPNTTNPAAPLLSQSEYNLYASSTRYGVAVINGEAVLGKFVSIPNSSDIFVVENNSQYSVYRHSDTAADYPYQIDIQDYEEFVNAGVWGSINPSAVQLHTHDAVDGTALTDAMPWINSLALIQTQGSNLDRLSIYATTENAKDSLGHTGSASIDFQLNMASGAISNGTFTSYLFAPDYDENIAPYTSSWGANFTGSLNFQTGVISTVISNVTMGADTANDSGWGTGDVERSNIGGVRIGEDRNDGFLGWFNLHANWNNQAVSTSGVVLGYAAMDFDSELAENIFNGNHERVSYVFFNNQVYTGGYFQEGNNYSFYGMPYTGRYGDIFIARSNSVIGLGSGANFGTWGNANNPILLQLESGSADSTLPRSINSLTYADALTYEFTATGNPIDLLRFNTSSSNFVGIDSANNALTSVNGSFLFDRSSGDIHNGFLNLTYGNANTGSVWNMSFSGYYEVRSMGLDPVLTSITMAGEQVEFASAMLTGFVFSSAQDINGAFTAHNLSADAGNIWANGIVQWGSQTISNPTSSLLSNVEYFRYLIESRAAVIVADNGAVYGKLVTLPDYSQIFISDNNSQYSVYRTTGSTSALSWSLPLDLEWYMDAGAWGSSNPSEVTLQHQGQQQTNMTNAVEWLAADIYKPSASLDKFQMNASMLNLRDSFGHSGNGDISFDLDMATGNITNGIFAASLSNGSYYSNWSSAFTGTTNIQTGFISTTLDSLTLGASTANGSYNGTPNLSQSNIDGFLVGNSDVTGMVGWFNLHATWQGNAASLGGIWADVFQPNIDPVISENINNGDYDRISYVFLNNTVYAGGFFEENGQYAFYGKPLLDDNNYVAFVARSNDPLTLSDHEVNWGAWGTSNNPVHLQKQDGDIGVPVRVTNSVQFADAMAYDFIASPNGPYHLNFNTSPQQFVGVDSFDNALTEVDGYFTFDSIGGGITGGNLELTYGTATEGSVWDLSFSGDYSGRHMDLTTSLNSVTIAGSNATPGTALMDGTLFQNSTQDGIGGAFTAHQLHADSSWATGIIQWHNAGGNAVVGP